MTRFSVPTLETERLILRAPRFSDFEGFAAFHGSDRARFVGGPVTDPSQLSRAFGNLAGMWMLRGYGMFILERRDTLEPVGHAGAWHPVPWPERELGWCLWSGEVEGKGYVTEAMRRIHTWTFSDLGWRTCVSYIDPDNGRSAAVAERLGARLDPTAPSPDGDPCLVYRHSKGAA